MAVSGSFGANGQRVNLGLGGIGPSFGAREPPPKRRGWTSQDGWFWVGMAEWGGGSEPRDRRHITSTKNSLGFPMAMWKDWRLAVSSGGTEPRSRTGGAPGGCMAGGGRGGGGGGTIITIIGL